MDELENIKKELNDRLSERTASFLDQIGKLQRELDYTKAELKKTKDKTLAQRCYESEEIDMELFQSINKILGTKDLTKCCDEGFVFEAEDVWWDSYDNSVEITRPESSEWMTENQARQIINLGFIQIYESKGEEGRNIFLFLGEQTIICDRCDPRTPRTEERLRRENSLLRERIEKAEGKLAYM